jgi:hypothetical protein
MIGSEAGTAALLEEFVSVAGGDAASSELAHMRYGSLKNYLAERGPGDQEDEHGRPYMKSEFFREPLPAHAVEALLELFVRDFAPAVATFATASSARSPSTSATATALPAAASPRSPNLGASTSDDQVVLSGQHPRKFTHGRHILPVSAGLRSARLPSSAARAQLPARGRRR